MNLYEAQDFFKKMYPDKLVTFEFDKKCIRTFEIVHTDGKPNPYHHIEYNQVKVTPQDAESIYVPIAPHRMSCSWDESKKHINSLSDPV